MASNRLAIIGDSFVEAVEVNRAHHSGALLHEKWHARSTNTAVFTLGIHGTGPAQYLEVLRYACGRYDIREAVLMVYLGNDITDCSRRFVMHDPEAFIYYTLAPDGTLTLDPTGEKARQRYQENLSRRDRPLWQFLPRLLFSHCMLVQVPVSIRQATQLRRRMRDNAARVMGFDADVARLGLKAAPFAVPTSSEGAEAMTILTALLDKASNLAREHSIRLRIVTVPFFPPDFYAQRNTMPWTTRLGGYDFLKPERELEAWAEARGISMLALGKEMSLKRLPLETIRSFYLSNGSGHFSETGHRYAAEAMDRTFYTPAR